MGSLPLLPESSKNFGGGMMPAKQKTARKRAVCYYQILISPKSVGPLPVGDLRNHFL